MNFKTWKQTALKLAIATAFLLPVGAASSSTAYAQIWQRPDIWRGDRDRDRRDDRRDDRWEDRNGRGDNRGRNNSWYREQEQKGFRDGLRRGQEDSDTNRIPDPNNSSHYRKGNEAYRDGFRDGYRQGYRQNNRNDRYDRNRRRY
jgi:hypothetical protein